ncbi:chymotrypsin-1-like [Trichogramma pretiosum]|uniref:chymotrypsin-1-like n=1 Tax=Trichogramma pretiosum TaxID=7493 RepID=UPI000C71C5F3|nr:chymotrypsin-1-like [Trichogramma pretiosum]
MILKLLILSLLAASTFGQEDDSVEERLLGARPAENGEFPYQASLRVGTGHICGAALIGKKHVLTAAHCLYALRDIDTEYVSVLVGTNDLRLKDGTAYAVSKMTYHPGYVEKKSPDWMYDVGVIELKDEVKLTDRVGIVKLPTEAPKPGSTAIVTGWGATKAKSPTSPILQKLNLRVISLDKCRKSMPSYARVHQSHVCTYVGTGLGSCSGDSGGPLVSNGVIIGIVSGGIPCARGYPDVFTSVYDYLPYIKSIVTKA